MKSRTSMLIMYKKKKWKDIYSIEMGDEVSGERWFIKMCLRLEMSVPLCVWYEPSLEGFFLRVHHSDYLIQ